eukprot:4089350-Prorocentrum_lima.AAC.1
MQNACTRQSLQPLWREVESLMFDDGDTVISEQAFVDLVGVCRRRGRLDVAYMDRDCPGLLSRTAWKKAWLQIGLGQRRGDNGKRFASRDMAES